MLRSTHKPSAAATAALPPCWSEHKAPTGHLYYYNSETKESTYTRPVGQVVAEPPAGASSNSLPYAGVPSLSDPRAANAYLAQFRPQPQPQGQHGRGRGGFSDRPKPQPTDKPRRREPIPGHEPWILVYTKYSRRFVYNPAKNASYWRIPEKLMPGILELDKARIRDKANEGEATEKTAPETDKVASGLAPEQGPARAPPRAPIPMQDELGDSSEYEEVEVTDDEGAEVDDGDGHPSKRQRIDDEEAEAVEFTEDDIAAQLQAMGADYGLEQGEYDDGHMEDWPEGAEGVEFSGEDAKLLFKDLLNDFRINPYSPWEKLIDEGKIIDDSRYTALSTTKARKECWDEWSRERIAALKEERSRQEKKDPRLAYMAFLQEKATPKLYWPEFKRKYKKEPPMKDMNLAEKDKEKAYREHVARLRLPQATLKSDLMALLRAQPAHVLHGGVSTQSLPTAVLVDPRYVSLDPAVRDPMVEAYIQTLAKPTEADGGDAAGQDVERQHKERKARERRERALEERNRAVEEQRRQRERDVSVSKARLRETERELEAAMRVDKRGLQSQLAERQRSPTRQEEDRE